jgi:hypothetical protein
MHAIEWVSIFSEAVVRLRTDWDIPSSVAEDIVRNVVQGGRVEIRATHRYRASLVPQIVTGKIQLSQAGLWAPDYETIEIDYNGLFEEGLKLIPSWIHVTTSKRTRSTPNKAASLKKKAQRRGPLPGTIDRFNDAELFAEIDQMTRDRQMSVNEATLKLAYADKVDGLGSSSKESRASRLARRYRKYLKNSIQHTPTRSN